MKYFIILLVTCFLLSCGSRSPMASSKTITDSSKLMGLPKSPVPQSTLNFLHDQVMNYYNVRLRATGFNGQMLVAYKGNIVFEAYNGTAHMRGNDSINEHTPFHIASTSKTFTAMAVLKLMQEGKLSLSDPFSKYFPEFPYTDVTIKTLLNHRSGLPNYTNFLEPTGWNTDSTLSNRDVLNQVILHPELVARANRGFMYCNTNFALLALLIEKVSGLTYPQYIRQNFFEPLGMKDSFVSAEITDSSRLTPSYTWFGRQEAFNYLDAVYGDKNIYSTVRDLYKWDQFLYTNTIFSPATLDSAFTPCSFEKRGKKNYGLGWRMLLLPNGKKPIYHNGWWHGNNSTFYRLTQDSASIIILNNRFNRNTYHANELADLFGSYGLSGEEGLNENDPSRPDSVFVPKPLVLRKKTVHKTVRKKSIKRRR